MPANPHLIEAPAVEQARFGLIDTIGLTPMDAHSIMAGITYDAAFCGAARTWTGYCETPTGDKVADDGGNWVEGSPVTVYHLFTCRLPGSTAEDRTRRAGESLDLGASRALEEGFGAVIGTGAVDLGGPVSPVVAIAELEQYAGENYGGQAVLHLTRRAALIGIQSGAIIRVGSRLETVLGSIVVAGAGYAGSVLPSAPTAGAEWGYVTGAVNLFEADVVVNEMALQRDVSGGYTNEFAALAERVYVPSFECIHAAIEIEIVGTP